MTTPEAAARANIDRQLEQAGWIVQDRGAMNLYAGPGVAVREFPLAPGHGFADYLLYVNQRAVGVVEAKAEGATLSGVEVQSRKYAVDLPDPDVIADVIAGEIIEDLRATLEQFAAIKAELST